MGKFMRGDIVVLNFPFSDLSEAKRRPALVISDLCGDDVILCQITKNKRCNMTANFTAILFDLDGTLTDPRVGITRAVQYSLRSFGIEVADPDTLTHFIGPPLWDSYGKYYGFDADVTKAAVAKYREYFSERGIFENTLYPGIPELLRELRGAGKILALATSKPTVYAEKILAHFGLDVYFTFAAGSEMDGSRSRKSEVIRYALDNLRLTDPAAAVMTGDREHDIIGAKETGTTSAGVLWGYGSREELAAAGADYIINNVLELEKLLVY